MEREPPQTPTENPPPHPTSTDERVLRDILRLQVNISLPNHPDHSHSPESVENRIDDMISEVKETHPGISLVNAMLCLLMTRLDIRRVPEVPRDLVGAIREHSRLIEREIAEHKKWAQQKGIQFAERVMEGVMEIKSLGMEKAVDDWVRKQVRKVEEENELIKKEIEKYKSELKEAGLEEWKLDKKLRKRQKDWEAQKEMLAKGMAEVKEKLEALHLSSSEVDQVVKEAKAKWLKEVTAREAASKQIQGIRGKIASEDSIEVMLSIKKIYDKFLEEICEEPQPSSPTSPLIFFTLFPTYRDLSEQRAPENISNRRNKGYCRKCLTCMTNEVSVVFLPCAHQILCAICNIVRNDKTCLCCDAHIDERIAVKVGAAAILKSVWYCFQITLSSPEPAKWFELVKYLLF